MLHCWLPRLVTIWPVPRCRIVGLETKRAVPKANARAAREFFYVSRVKGQKVNVGWNWQMGVIKAAAMSRHAQRVTYLLIALALLLRAMVPAGWMPASSGALFAIEPCPAVQSAAIMVMAAHHAARGEHGSHGAQHDGDCAFAPLAGDFAASEIPAPIPFLALATLRPIERPAVSFFATGPPGLLPPATGPPALA